MQVTIKEDIKLALNGKKTNACKLDRHHLFMTNGKKKLMETLVTKKVSLVLRSYVRNR